MNPNSIRPDFPILDQTIHGKFPLVYLDNAASTQRPTAVIEAMSTCYRRDYANVHRGIHELSERSSALYESARQTLADFVGVNDPTEIIFTSGTTAALNLVAHSWSAAHLREGDEILLTILEHHSNIVPWQQAATRHGARVLFSPLRDDGSFDLEAWKSSFSSKTKIVSFAAVSNVMGYRLPLEAMTEFAKSRGAAVCLDAAQSVPYEITNFVELGVDFAAFSGHKMLGPSGVGVLFGRRELLESIPPFLGGGSMISQVTTSGFEPGELPAKFEAGTPPIVEAIGLAAAADYLKQIGLNEIARHEKQLGHQARELLGKIPGVKFLNNSKESTSGIVSFHVPGVSAQDIAVLLDRKGIAVRAGHHCTMPLHEFLKIPASLRASFYLYNTAEEVETFATRLDEIVRRLAA
jgi:cysteine desulfurase / selenocysteine lyase